MTLPLQVGILQFWLCECPDAPSTVQPRGLKRRAKGLEEQISRQEMADLLAFVQELQKP